MFLFLLFLCFLYMIYCRYIILKGCNLETSDHIFFNVILELTVFSMGILYSPGRVVNIALKLY